MFIFEIALDIARNWLDFFLFASLLEVFAVFRVTWFLS